jgi:hypothetical protein
MGIREQRNEINRVEHLIPPTEGGIPIIVSTIAVQRCIIG